MPRKPAMTPEEKKNIRRIAKELAKLDGLSLGEWIEAAAKIDPLMEKVVGGIYCGEDGKMMEQLGNYDHYVIMHWHKMESGRLKVEVSYLS